MLLFRRGPYAHPSSRGGYDIALAAAAFEQPVSLDCLYADQASLEARGLQAQELAGFVTAVDEHRVQALLSEHHRVLVF